jgi:hypothetical protein
VPQLPPAKCVLIAECNTDNNEIFYKTPIDCTGAICQNRAKNPVGFQLSVGQSRVKNELIEPITNGKLYTEGVEGNAKRSASLDPQVQRPTAFSQRKPSNFIAFTESYVIRCSIREHASTLLSIWERESQGGIFQHHYKATKKLEHFKLSDDAIKIYKEPNAGGSSINSEALSADVLGKLYNVTDIVTEMEINYKEDNWKKCDYLVSIWGENVGVSVTRGMRYPTPDLFDREDAVRLLKRKLGGLAAAQEGIQPNHYFHKSILHIWCETKKIAEIITKVYHTLEETLKNNIVVVLTITNDKSKYIYYDKLDQSLYEKYQKELLANS